MVPKPKTPKTPGAVTPIDITEVDASDIPKAARKSTGTYAQVRAKLKDLPNGKAVSILVERRTQANGYSRTFSKDGFDVITRNDEESKKIRVWIGHGIRKD